MQVMATEKIQEILTTPKIYAGIYNRLLVAHLKFYFRLNRQKEVALYSFDYQCLTAESAEPRACPLRLLPRHMQEASSVHSFIRH